MAAGPVLRQAQVNQLRSVLIAAAKKAYPNRDAEWMQEIDARTAEALRSLEELLVRYPLIADEFRRKLEIRKRKRGRRRLTEKYWLAAEIAEIVANVPGVQVKYSKLGVPTVYMKILEICFASVGHDKSIERFAAEVAKERQPPTVDDETWADYKEAISKRRKRTNS